MCISTQAEQNIALTAETSKHILKHPWFFNDSDSFGIHSRTKHREGVHELPLRVALEVSRGEQLLPACSSDLPRLRENRIKAKGN